MENKIIEEILKEKERQISLWGEQNHPAIAYNTDNISDYYNIPSEKLAKYNCDKAAEQGNLTWGDIIVEELVEALNAKNSADMKEELIQCAACIISAIESLERNGK